MKDLDELSPQTAELISKQRKSVPFILLAHDGELCPIKSFEFFVSKVHPKLQSDFAMPLIPNDLAG